MYRTLEAQLFSGVPGVVPSIVCAAETCKKVHISAATGAIVPWRAWWGGSLSAEVCQKSSCAIVLWRAWFV
jgi:hypothetical protein